MRKGSRGDAVRELQVQLNLRVDGIFGPLTEEAVMEWQRAHGLEADGIVGAKTWATLGHPKTNGGHAKTKGGNLKTNGRKVTEIIVHCTATPEGEDYTVDDVRRWHLERGFTDVGYHFLVYRDGTIHVGRPEAVAGAHCTGHNTRSIGVCYVGGCPGRSDKDWQRKSRDTRTAKQRAALVRLVGGLKRKYAGAKVYGHRDFAAKECPGFDARTEYADL